MLSNQAKVESLIFVSGNEGISITDLAHLTGLLKPAINEQLKLLVKKYNTDKTCSFELVQTGETVKFTTKKAFAPLIKSYFEAPATTTLSQAAIETLAIIAYKQPITRIDIEEIRGVKASGMIQKLMALEPDVDEMMKSELNNAYRMSILRSRYYSMLEIICQKGSVKDLNIYRLHVSKCITNSKLFHGLCGLKDLLKVLPQIMPIWMVKFYVSTLNKLRHK